MKGFGEVLISFTIGLMALAAFGAIQKREPPIKGHPAQKSQPVVLTGPALDPQLKTDWALEQIHLPSAWKRFRPKRDVVVAVIDTGCDVHHPDLRSSLWINPGESGLDEDGHAKSSNGIDDDGNGFIDDVHGWNFIADSNDLTDQHGHGTHIAGLIGARPASPTGMQGVSKSAQLMILKYYDTESAGGDNLRHTLSAIRYAVKMGADVINYSGGGLIPSADEEKMLKWASEQGVLVVAAAGNEGLNSDFYPFYPADYELPNILSVTAIDRHQRLLGLSNFGLHSVDLAAPGKNIYSTLPGGLYGYMTGTSQATALVSGVAALALSQSPIVTAPKDLIRLVLDSTVALGDLHDKTRSGGRVDAESLMQELDRQNATMTTVARSPSRTPSL